MCADPLPSHRRIVWIPLQYKYLYWPKEAHTADLRRGHHVGGDDNTKGTKMGEAPGEKHFLLRRTGDDGPAEGRLLPDPLPHHRDLRPLLRFRVSHIPWQSYQLLQKVFATPFRLLMPFPVAKNIESYSLIQHFSTLEVHKISINSHNKYFSFNQKHPSLLNLRVRDVRSENIGYLIMKCISN